MSALRALAPAKVNLGLFLGPTRAQDRRHELVTVMQALSLADVLELAPAPAEALADELHCPGVAGAPGENLAARALALFRERTAWRAPPLRLSIEKRIPVAAGLAGGSADAAATLRLARAASGLGGDELLGEIAGELGADVPAQLSPGRWLAGGAGERLSALPAPVQELELLLLPCAQELSTAAVYAEADRLALPRGEHELERLRERLALALAHGEALPSAAELLDNDLQPAALSLCPPIADSLAASSAVGAQHVLVCGSGPTVAALFAGERAGERAALAGRALAGRAPRVIRAGALTAELAAGHEVRPHGQGDAGLRNNPQKLEDRLTQRP